jgi:acetyltransferase-like isoleucine patch superfamily enzyme
MSEEQKRDLIEIQKKLEDKRKSPLQKYRQLVVGHKGFWFLLKYELILLICSGMPGALGLWLRSKLYPSLMGKVGKNVIFGENIVLRHPRKVFIGDNVTIDSNCVLDAKGEDNEGIFIGNGVFVGRNSILSCKNGSIYLKDHVNIGFNCEIMSASSVTIGEKTLIAAYTYIIGGGHEYSLIDKAVLDQGRTSRGVELGNSVWLGAGVKVLDGVKIGHNTIIGAGAVVTKDIPENSIAVGNPAQVKKKRE